jgi:cation transport regulator
MTYNKNSDLPQTVKNALPKEAQDIYREAFNNALLEYKEANHRNNPNETQETVAHKVAWAAVKKKYHKEDGEWVMTDEASEVEAEEKNMENEGPASIGNEEEESYKVKGAGVIGTED